MEAMSLATQSHESVHAGVEGAVTEFQEASAGIDISPPRSVPSLECNGWAAMRLRAKY